MTRFTVFTLLALSSLFAACTSEPVYEQDAFLGDWSCISIERNGAPMDLPAGGVGFSFADSTYVYTGGAHEEEGTWWLSGKHLYTQAEDLKEKRVLVRDLRNDTLWFDLEDNGVPMEMVLVREAGVE